MRLEAFENLELIPDLLSAVKQMSDRMAKFAPPLTSKKEVARFLGKTERTINNYMSQGYLKDGYHYFHKSAKMIVFDEDAILEFRDKLSRGIVNEKVTI
ncbi:MAG: helix-turn-helix domain-containing protein [Sulfurimonas sp.]